MPFAATRMDLEIIILSEVSQKEKDKYHMISHIWEAAALHGEISLVLCDHLEGGIGRETQEGGGYGDICIHIADSLCYTAETNTTL